MKDRVRDKLHSFESEHIWLEEHRAFLLEKYSDQWVAVRSGQVIASCPDFSELLSKLSDPAHTCIEYITRESVEMIL